MKRNVSFASIERREYSICLSDHPSCSYGPPIELGWDFVEHEAINVEDYEVQRLERHGRPREMHELLLSYNVRRYLLLKRAGYTKRDIANAMQEVNRIKTSRMITDLLLPVDETLEQAMDHIRGLFGGGQSVDQNKHSAPQTLG